MDKILFWDFHGTLIRPDPIWSRNIYQAARDVFPECPISLQQVRDRLDHDGFPWHHPEQTYLDLIEPAAWWNYVNRLFYTTYRRCGLTDEDARQIVPDVRTRILDPTNFVLFDSAVKVLDNLRQSGWHHILLSNNFPELPEICRKIGIGDYFEQVIVSARVGYEKPRREIFQLALEEAGYPQTCFMVGDNPEADIAGARAVGIPGILVYNDRPDSPGTNLAVYHCQDLLNLQNLLLRLS